VLICFCAVVLMGIAYMPRDPVTNIRQQNPAQVRCDAVLVLLQEAAKRGVLSVSGAFPSLTRSILTEIYLCTPVQSRN
jgi:hypothetical protein